MLFLPSKIDDPQKAIEFCKITGIPELDLEPVIAKDASASMWYAENILKGRFKAGEEAIAADPFLAMQYAMNVLKRRFYKGESIIAKSHYAMSYYRRFKDSFAENRFVKAEYEIESSEDIFTYTRLSGKRYVGGELSLLILAKENPSKIPLLIEYYTITKYRHHEFELEISKYPLHSYHYAIELNKRFEMGEKAIAEGRDPDIAFLYIKEIVREPLPLFESLLAKKAKTSYFYADQILKERFVKGEPTIAKESNIAYFYALNVIKGRFPEAERLIARDPRVAFLYAKEVIKGKFKLGERSIYRSQKYTMQYSRMIRQETNVKQATICPRCCAVNILNIERRVCKCSNCVHEFDLDDERACTRKVRVKPDEVKDFLHHC